MTEDENAVSLYLSGMTFMQVMAAIGRSQTFVAAALRRAGVKHRARNLKGCKRRPIKPRAPLVVRDGVGYIPTSDAQTFMVDESDVPLVAQYNWCVGVNGVPRASVNGKMTTIHKLLNPTWRECDHVSTDQLDNRRSNLRECSRRENVCNRRKASVGAYSSRFKGVSLDRRRGRFTASITYEGKCHYLGSFVTEEEAHKAYAAAATKYHGAFARA